MTDPFNDIPENAWTDALRLMNAAQPGSGSHNPPPLSSFDRLPNDAERDTAERLTRAYREITAVGKTSQADLGSGGHFKFRGIDALLDAVHKVLAEEHLRLIVDALPEHTRIERERWEQRFKDGGSRMVSTTYATVWVDVWCEGPTGGRAHIGRGVGNSFDNGDKAVSKAHTVAFRDCLYKAFTVPVTGAGLADIEAEDLASETAVGPDTEPWSDEQADEISGLIAELKAMDRAAEAAKVVKDGWPAVSLGANPRSKRHPTDEEADEIIYALRTLTAEGRDEGGDE